MLASQRLLIEQSEVRQRISAALGKDELSDDERGKMDVDTKRAQQIETEYRAALVVEGEPTETPSEDGEGRELRSIRSNADFGAYLSASLERRSVVDGAELELNQAMNIPLDRFPLEMLLGDLETRALIDGDAQGNQQTWIDRLFADTAAMSLGISMPSVAAGVAAYPLLVSDAAGAQRGRTQAAAAATISATVTEVKPTRNAVHAVYSVEDDARLPGLADSIRRDLQMAMTEKIDRTIFLGDSGANENTADIAGLTTATGVTELELEQSEKVKYADILALLSGLIDGKYATSMADIRIVASVGSNTLWLSTIANTNRNETVAQVLRSNGVTWMTRGEIEDATANGDFGAFIGLQRGIANAGVAPVWSSAQLITDVYSGAKSGEVQLSLNYLWGLAFPRAANFRRLKYVT